MAVGFRSLPALVSCPKGKCITIIKSGKKNKEKWYLATHRSKFLSTICCSTVFIMCGKRTRHWTALSFYFVIFNEVSVSRPMFFRGNLTAITIKIFLLLSTPSSLPNLLITAENNQKGKKYNQVASSAVKLKTDLEDNMNRPSIAGKEKEKRVISYGFLTSDLVLTV